VVSLFEDRLIALSGAFAFEPIALLVALCSEQRLGVPDPVFAVLAEAERCSRAKVYPALTKIWFRSHYILLKWRKPEIYLRIVIRTRVRIEYGRYSWPNWCHGW